MPSTVAQTTPPPSQYLMPLAPQPWQPGAAQRKGVKFGVERACAALWLDPGMGKTSIVYAVFKILRKAKIARRMLVVAPLRPCYLVWPLEQQKWTDFTDIQVAVLHGPGKEAKLKDTATEVFVINPEGLPWLLPHLKGLDIDILVVDESSKFKNTQSKRFKLLRPYLPTFARRYTLTGTPASNGYEDVFGQIYVTDTGRSLGQWISHYRNTYFDSTGYGGYTYVLKPGAEKLIQERLRPVVLRLDAADYHDLPALIGAASSPNPLVVGVQLPPAARKVYQQMDELMIAELTTGDKVTAQSAAAASIKCRQVANGGLYLPLPRNSQGQATAPRTWQDIHTAKVDAVVDFVEELAGQQVLIAYEFEHDLARLRKALPNAAVLGSGTTPKQADEIVRRWNAGELTVLLGQPASMGHGLNMQYGGNHILWHSLTFDLELYDQFNRRIYGRQGSKHKHVYVHHVVAYGTVDEIMLDRLGGKHATQQGLLNALKGRKSRVA